MELLQVKNLTFTYPGQETPALQEVSFSVKSGDFAVICGESGCGKTTLLRLLKRELAPHGVCAGEIYYDGILQQALDARRSAGEIGFVLQNPESQIVTDKVWHELAFGLENLGLPTPVIRRRVGEMAGYFGIQDWYHQDTASLSGGQKQILNLASIMVMQPNLLILDEPTSQLDPIAASDFIHTLQKLNRELGLTVILVEHRLEEVFPMADQVLVLDHGKILFDDAPSRIEELLKNMDGGHPMLEGLPSAVRIFHSLAGQGPCPLSVKEGRAFLQQFDNKIQSLPELPHTHSDKAAITLKNVWFRYERELPDILRGVDLTVYQGEIFCLLGGNGAGKTTLLNVISGLGRAYRGKVIIDGRKLALLPQDPQTVFLKQTVREDFGEICKVMGYGKEESQQQIDKVAKQLGITALLERHPYDVSGGEQQKCALAKMLLLQPEILLLDEPTKGIDANAKKDLAVILQALRKEGMTILLVTHDVEFAAIASHRCGLFFDGEVLSQDTPTAFFSDNHFYTTAANRIARGRYQGAITCEDVIALCEKNGRLEE